MRQLPHSVSLLTKLDPKLQAQLGQMFAAPEGESELSGALILVDVAKLQTAEQPGTYFDAALRDLENSIRELNAAGKGIGGSGGRAAGAGRSG